jgi:hypothetical protein
MATIFDRFSNHWVRRPCGTNTRRRRLLKIETLESRWTLSATVIPAGPLLEAVRKHNHCGIRTSGDASIAFTSRNTGVLACKHC